MQDIPMFTTEFGVASLALKEVPYKATAYITIRSANEPERLLQECIQFCKMSGAKEIYATGHTILDQYPLHTAIWQMGILREQLPQTDAALFPVTEKTIDFWRKLYNEKMLPIANASTMTRADGEKLVQQGGGYFIHRGEKLLGIGIARGDTVESVISAVPGAGRDVMLALCGSLYAETIRLEVASTNSRAIKLYENLGFCKTKEISCWYDVLTRKNT